jgi:pimeloyl-ACP methyl ester carboxylesterase
MWYFISMSSKHAPHISDTGGDGQLVIMLPGFPAPKGYWRSTQLFLHRKGFRVVSLDLLGLGNAPKPDSSEYGYSEHVEYIEEVIAKIPRRNEPFVLIGHSMGALLAARYAVNNNNLLIKLVLLNPPLYSSREEAQQTLINTSKLYRLLLEAKYRSLAWSLISILSLRKIAKHTHISRERSLTNVVQSAEIFEDLSKIKTDTLLLLGKRDRPEYLENIKTFRIHSNIDLRIEDVGHHSAIFEKKILRELLLNYLNDALKPVY